ncbi:MAG: ATP-dependent zinc metalloprotease FtsH [bacterium]
MLMLLLLVWFLILQPRGRKSITIPYSEFKKEVKQNRIQSITVKGQQITGEFSEFYLEIDKKNEDTLTYTYFSTIKPPFEDTELIGLLEKHEVEVKASKKDGSWLQTALIFLLPWILIIGYFVYMGRKMKGGKKGMMGGGIFDVGKSRVKRYKKGSSNVTFKDVAGLKNAKQDLREIIDYLKEPEKFKTLGADIPKGVLLMGPPGTGKTLLGRATAGEADVSFFSISGSEFIEMFVGVGASRVRDMFNKAKKEAPAVIFIDEIDSVGRSRGTGLGGGHDEREQTLNQILSEMDGFLPNQSVVVIAATNRPDVLDPALTRPGRFDRQITLELPVKDARKEILKIHTQSVPLAQDTDLNNIAARTVGFSGADLKNLVNEAALLAGRKGKNKVEPKDFDKARDKILLGAEREETIEDDEKRLISYHEAGHALIATKLPHADPLQKVTIIPRGRSLGVTEQIPESDRHNLSKSYMLDRITVALGGRAAEKLMFKEMTNGAANDLKHVTRIVRRMITQWGMSERLGPRTFRQDEDHPFLGREMASTRNFSEETARIIDEEIQRILKDMETRALDILKQNRKQLDALSNALLDKETLDGDEIESILKSQKQKKK